MITARLDHAGIDRLLDQIAARGTDLRQPLSSCGEIMLSSIDRNFQSQGRYLSAGDVRGGSNRWQKLSPATVLARIGGKSAFGKRVELYASARRKLEGMKILQRSGSLAASFSKQASGNTLVIGSNKAYAAIHHFGGQAGRGKKVSIPARPMLVVQDEDIGDMMDVLQKHLIT